MKIGRTTSAYLLRAVLPYFLMAWLILTVILFLQQAARYSEIFFSPNLPAAFAWKLTFALIPNVIAFTCPMAVLVGVIVGLSRMQIDNELIAIRSFGIGSAAILFPILLLGFVLSLLSLVVNIYGVPLASRAVRNIATTSAVYKLESPIEPGVFNSEIAGFTVYVRDGDLEKGQWKNVFVFSEDQVSGSTRLITSKRGRIDAEGQNSELVLQEASVTTFNEASAVTEVIRERVGEVRFAIRTRRDDMIDRLNSIQPAIEELGLSELFVVARSNNEKDSNEAEVLIARRLGLAISPMIFCMLGSALILRFYRRGRGFGVVLALVTLLVYFLVAFAGEQLARSGSIAPLVGGLLPLLVSAMAMTYLLLGIRFPSVFRRRQGILDIVTPIARKGRKYRGTDRFLDLTTGIRDFELSAELSKYFVYSILFLGFVFVVFTGFDLWRYAGSFVGGTALLGKYIVFLMPFVYLQIAPTAVLLTVIAVFTIKSRQNEIVTWLSAGESVYRLILPCIILMSFLGAINFGIQEWVAVPANIRQDAIRYKIRNRGVAREVAGRQWAATDASIVSYEFSTSASDNEITAFANCSNPCALKNLSIYKFAVDSGDLQFIYRIPEGRFGADGFELTGSGEVLEFSGETVKRSTLADNKIDIGISPLGGTAFAASRATVRQMRDAIEFARSDIERRNLQVGLEKKYSILALPLVVALIAIPFAIGVDRKNRVIGAVYAVGLWLIFVTFGSIFEQLGLNGSLPPVIAVWSPIVLFAIIGAYLISRVRT